MDQDYDDEGSALHDDYQFDFDRCSQLLSIVKSIAEVAPSYVNISSEAMAELKEIDQELAEVRAERAEVLRKAQAEKLTHDHQMKLQAREENENPALSDEARQQANLDPALSIIPGQPVPTPPIPKQGTRQDMDPTLPSGAPPEATNVPERRV